MKNFEETFKILDQAEKYLDKKFLGVNNYLIIGFLEDFKRQILEEIQQEGEKE